MSFNGNVDVTIDKDNIKVSIPDDKLNQMVDAYKGETVATAPATNSASKGGSRRSRRTKSKSNKSKKSKRRRTTRRRKH